MTFNRITAHHTGGPYTPTAKDLQSYPICIDGDGQPHEGIHPLDANAAGRKLTTGTYYPHTWKLNSGNFGIAICSMGRASWEDPRGSTRFFPHPRQVDALIRQIAKWCNELRIEVTGRTVLSHAEVEPVLGVKQKQKWDYDYQLRNTPGRDPVAIFDEIRQEVRNQFKGVPVTPPPPVRPTLRQGASGPSVVLVQNALRIKADGIFGPRTRAAVTAFQKSRDLLPDGVVSRMTWAALGL